MKFTAELEYKKNISFLDLRVIRESDDFIADAYRKTKFSGTYLHWNILSSDYKIIYLMEILLDRISKI